MYESTINLREVMLFLKMVIMIQNALLPYINNRNRQADEIGLVFPKTLQNRINIFQAIVDVIQGFGPGENNFAIDKNQQHDSRFDHSID